MKLIVLNYESLVGARVRRGKQNWIQNKGNESGDVDEK